MSNPGIVAATMGWSAREELVWALAAVALVIGAASVFLLRGTGWRRRTAGGLVLACAVSLGIWALRERTVQLDRAAEREVFSRQAAALTGQTLAPASPLACLDGLAGDTVDTACENAVFGSAENVARSVSYLAARFDLIRDGQARFADDAGMAEVMRGLRRPLEADRFGIVAHLLQVRDECDTFRCDALAFLADPSRVKSNLRSQLYAGYVTRHAPSWGATAAQDPPPMADNGTPGAFATASVAAAPPPGAVETPAGPRQVAVPLSSKYDFPSAASIPPVSIMTPEPGPTGKSEASRPETGAAAPAATPLPPRRPPPVRAAATRPPPQNAPRAAPGGPNGAGEEPSGEPAADGTR